MSAWLMENDIVPEVGRRFTFRSRPMGDWDGTVACEVLAVRPQRLLSYSWRGGGTGNRLDTDRDLDAHAHRDGHEAPPRARRLRRQSPRLSVHGQGLAREGLEKIAELVSTLE